MPAELVERLPVFGLRIGIRHDAAPDREVRGPVDDGRGADRDVPVQGPVPRDVAECACVYAAAVRLEAFDDLHRTWLGRSRDRANGGPRPEEFRGRHILAEAPAGAALPGVRVRGGA